MFYKIILERINLEDLEYNTNTKILLYSSFRKWLNFKIFVFWSTFNENIKKWEVKSNGKLINISEKIRIPCNLN